MKPKNLLLFLAWVLFAVTGTCLKGSAQTAPNGSLPIQHVYPMEYWCPYLGSNNILYAYNAGNLYPVPLPLPGGQTVQNVAGCFNRMMVVSNTGNLYIGGYYNADYTNWTLIPKDTLGNTINNAVNAWGYEDAYVLLRSDGSLWLGGGDDVNVFTTSTTTFMAPIKLTPAGSTLQFTSAAIESWGILAICTDGSVYEWNAGSGTSPKHITFSGGTGKALAVAIGNGNTWGNEAFAIVQQTPGSKYGHPYVWGNNSALWGSSTAQTFNTPTDLYSQWGLTSNVSEIAIGSSTMHVIDSAGNMYGAGSNVQGEVGTGVEYVNRYTYANWPNYEWDFATGENNTPFTKIGTGVKWQHLYANAWYTFYWYAMDASGNLYSWGRGKSFILGNGYWGGFVWNPLDPNLFDVTSPTLVTPMTTPLIQYGNITLPVRGAGNNQTITTSSTTVSNTGHPLWEVNSNKSSDTLCCRYASFQWVQESGPAGATIVNPGASSTVINGLKNGVYRFRVLTTDNHNGMDTASVQITCNLNGTAPSVSAGANKTITLPASTATLTGTASANDGSTISTYAWTEVSGPTTAGIGSAALASTAVSGLAQGVYIFELTATDGLGVAASATVQVTVNAGPGPPSATAGTTQTITLPTNSVTLAGSGTESNGTIVSYAWTQLSGPSTATIASSNQTSTQVTGLVQGTYRFQLTVTDALGITASATVQVIVNPSVTVPGPPSANAGTTQTITLPTNSVTLSGSGSESNGTIVTYAWTQLSGPNAAAINVPGSAVTGVSGLIQGSYRFQLMVTDALGITASANVQVIVNAAPIVPGPPSANAGSNQTITLPTNSVTLTGSGSETNGTIVTYAWTQVNGPNTATIANAGSAATGVSGLVQGTYRFQLTVTDNSGVTASATVQVIVNPAAVVPGPPSANAGANQTITLPTNTVTLTGSGSETNGTIVTYAWTQLNGPNTATINVPGSAVTAVSGLVQGTYRFELTVTDNSGVTASATVQVTVNAAPPVPGPPSANAGPDQTITLPTTSVTLSGSGSETNGTIVTYAWTQVTGPSTATIAVPGSAATAVTGLVQGAYVFRLTVTDNSGVTATDAMLVTVNPATPVPGTPSANAGSNQTITLPTNSLTLTGSGTESGGTIVTYAWTQVSGPNTATVANAGSAVTGVSGLVEGTYRFQLTVTDALGVTASATVQVTVNAAPVVPGPPSANAGPDQTITLPTNSVTLSGSGSETNGTIVTYAWTQVTGPSTATIAVPGSAATAVTGLVQGTYQFKLTVTDNSGVTASDVVFVTVKAAPAVPGPPSANAGPDQTITLPTSSVTLSGSGSETNGTIVTYAWTQVSGPNTAAINVPGSAATAVSGLVQGTYQFKLTVTDNSGVTASDVIFVTVKAAPVVPGPPSANAGPDQAITLPTSSVTASGSGSEANGTIVAYAWTQVSGPGTAAIANAGSAATGISGLVQGTYQFKLTVTDNSGVTASDVMFVTVRPAAAVPGPPSADAGYDQSITLPTNMVTLYGSGSETNGTIVSYAWTQMSGPNTAKITNPGNGTTQIQGLTQQGTYQFKLTVTDNSGVQATDVVIVTVYPAPVVFGPLSANAGSDQTITLPVNNVTLSGSGSETNGTIVSYFWRQSNGPATATIYSVNTASTGVGGMDVPGVYNFELVVTDGVGNTATATVAVTVKTHIPPVANAGPNTTTSVTSGLQLNGTGSYDVDGTIVSYSWVQLSGAGGVTITNENSATPTVDGLQPGVYVFQLTVTDDAGASASATVTITVTSTSSNTDTTTTAQPPVAIAGADTTLYYPNGDTAILNGSASYAPGSSIASYSWTEVSGPNEMSVTNSSSSVGMVANLTPGVYVFQLVVSNTAGDTASATVKVQVLDNQRQDEHVTLYPNPVQVGQQLTVTGSNGYSGQVNLLVVDMGGRVVRTMAMEKQAPTFVQTINVSGLARGVYVLRMEFGTGQKPMSLKFVVQ